jgi:hydrogenase maturation protease
MPAPAIICIGNVARGDDGVGWRVADLLAERLPEQARLVRAPALDVAMADDFEDVGVVVFVDAARRHEPAVRVRRLEAEPHGEYGHALSPGHLLEIAFALYASRPHAWLVEVAAPEMEHAEGLSETAEAASVEAASAVLRLIGCA